MACCSDIGTGAAANVLASLLEKVVQEVKLVICLPQAISDMEREVEHLNDVIRHITEQLDRVKKPPQGIVEAWLVKVDDAIKSSQSIRSDYEQHKNCISCCLNCYSRYRTSKRIIDWKIDVDRYHTQKQTDFPANGIYWDDTPPAHIEIEIPKGGYVGNAIKNAQSKLEDWLTKDSNVRIIGVYGMGGVGKTSLLRTINNSPEVRSSFYPIIWLPVSKVYDISELQDCIAERLKLHDFPRTNLEGRKNSLRSYLRDKKFLLLMDDLWEGLDLQSLGASLNDRGSKVVLTTRRRDVCTNMEAEEMRMETLSEEEGWELFYSLAFRNPDVHVSHDVAKKIARECKCLPLAINVVAAAMRKYTLPHEWDYALQQMRNIDEAFYGMHHDIERNLFQPLKWSYDDLPEYLKPCFVCFAAYPEDTVITCEEVIDIWIAEGLVKRSGDSYLPDTGHSFLNFLQDHCLIEVVKNDGVGRIVSVKIHDVLRDVVIRIVERKHECYFKAGVRVSQFPSQEDLHGCTKLSLMSSNLLSLPAAFPYSSLSVLLLRNNPGIEEVPENFLCELSSLRVLDLSYTRITSLPSCIRNLKLLSSLQLQGCKGITELPESIGDLKELQFLNVSDCDKLGCLPERISQLQRLRALYLSGCDSLRHLPRGISELVSLERLKSNIALDFEEEEEEALDAERKNACIKDLQSLSSLRVLEVGIKSALQQGVMRNWSKMRSLSLSFEEAVGQHYLPTDMQGMEDLESFFLHRCNVERLPDWVTEFQKLAYLCLHQCNQLKELPAELPCLRTLCIDGCSKLEALELGMGFRELQELRLHCLMSLKCVGIQGLMSLECVGIQGLMSLECVGNVGSASGSAGSGPLPPMLKSLRVIGCPKLKRLDGEWHKLNSLEGIQGKREWWDAIQWDDPNIKTSLESESKYREME